MWEPLFSNIMKNIKKLLAEIEKRKIIVAKQRDELREISSELEDLLQSFDEGIEGLEIGKAEIEGALDTLSQYV